LSPDLLAGADRPTPIAGVGVSRRNWERALEVVFVAFCSAINISSRFARQVELREALWPAQNASLLHFPDFIALDSNHEGEFAQFGPNAGKLLLRGTFFGCRGLFWGRPQKSLSFFMPQKSQKSPLHRPDRRRQVVLPQVVFLVKVPARLPLSPSRKDTDR
jgi:hypothetical protein